MAMILESENKSGNILHLAEDFLEGRGKWQREEKLHFEQLQRYHSPLAISPSPIEFLLQAFPNALAYKNEGEQSYKTKEGISVFCESKENAKLQKTTASLYAPVPEKYLPKNESHLELELQWKASQRQFVAMRVSNFGREECSLEERKSLESQTSAAWKALMEKEDFTSQWQTDANLALLAKMKLAAQLFPEHNLPKWDAEDFSLIMDEFCDGIFLLRDLSDFWQNTYPQLRKELRGRYPKHPWPEIITTTPAHSKP